MHVLHLTGIACYMHNTHVYNTHYICTYNLHAEICCLGEVVSVMATLKADGSLPRMFKCWDWRHHTRTERLYKKIHYFYNLCLWAGPKWLERARKGAQLQVFMVFRGWGWGEDSHALQAGPCMAWIFHQSTQIKKRRGESQKLSAVKYQQMEPNSSLQGGSDVY